MTLLHLIDDDDAVRDSLGLMLRGRGFNVREHPSAEDFLREFPPPQPGCIISDISMRGMSGFDLLRRLRELGDETPVIVITGRPEVDTRTRALALGAAAVFEKPLVVEDMLTAIQAVISE